jgi:hypothetical protein
VTTHPSDSNDTIVLHRLDVEDLAHLLGRVEDWLRHAGDNARDDLAEFLNAGGNGRLAAAGLVATLGEHTAVLHRRLKDVTS